VPKSAVRRADTTYGRALRQSHADCHGYTDCYSDSNSHGNYYAERYSYRYG